MALTIEYVDCADQHIYAFLFSSQDKTKAFNIDTGEFEEFSLLYQSTYAIFLEEDIERAGFYVYDIEDTSNIPATEIDDWYLVEVFSMLGSGPDRISDRLKGTQAFYWDGEREVPLGGATTTVDLDGVPEAIWSYNDRTLTEDVTCGDVTVDLNAISNAVWANEERTLTEEFGCPDIEIPACPEIPPCPEIPACPEVPPCPEIDIDAIKDLIEKKTQELIDLIKSQQPRTNALPNAQVPRLGPPGSSGGSDGVRFSR